MRLYDISIPVTLYTKRMTGVDGFNSATYEYEPIAVEHCLVAMNTNEPVLDTTSLEAKKDTFTIAIPKGDTNNWLDTFVEFSMGGESYRCRTYGDYLTGIDAMMPLEWHKQIKCIDVRENRD